MDFESKRAQRYREMRGLALRQFRANIKLAKIELEYAKIDRKHGYRADYLESLQNVAEYRGSALWWYARYRKMCQQIGNL